ncbi:unnamed protein product [Strongylus vulgaris]|uniref:Uncharacterized protein n=1 Tax=Strongylus vulgaris TaxID=40348 RepID=A0A3P7LEM4_STRVU|nr:unnamed protein product [Strongylus vulgaris]
MRIDQVVLRRRNDGYGYGMYDAFDDDDSGEKRNGRIADPLPYWLSR